MKQTEYVLPAEIKILYNHIYEYKKGVRILVLYTLNRQYSEQAFRRLESRKIDYIVQPAGRNNINLYFGHPECLEIVKLFADRPLNRLTPEEDFILGTLLGYDLCRQCKRFCSRKKERRAV